MPRPVQGRNGPANEQRLYEAQNDGIRYISGKLDEYGLTMQFAGVPDGANGLAAR